MSCKGIFLSTCLARVLWIISLSATPVLWGQAKSQANPGCEEGNLSAALHELPEVYGLFGVTIHFIKNLLSIPPVLW